jgi:hypothetical protein
LPGLTWPLVSGSNPEGRMNCLITCSSSVFKILHRMFWFRHRCGKGAALPGASALKSSPSIATAAVSRARHEYRGMMLITRTRGMHP